MIISHKSPHKSSRVNSQRDKKLNAGMDWKGAVFQIDPNSQRLIASRATRVLRQMMSGATVPDISWIAADNSVHAFAADEFLEFAEAVDAHVETLVFEAHQAKHG